MSRGVDLRGATVVITGASSGIGRESARRFARHGADVVLAARSEDSLRDVVAECEAAGGRALAVPTDVTDEDAVERLATRAVDRFGRIDVWVNNAAVMAYGALLDVPPRVQHRIIDVNLLGTMHGARAAVPVMRRQRHGVIVNVSSLYGRMTSPYVSAYATSKFGIRGFSQVLREELKQDRGIHVCTLMPGSIDTPIFTHAANYTGHDVKAVPPVSSPGRVARAVVRCATHPRRQRIVGTVHRVASWGNTVLPHTYADLVPHAMRLAVIGRGSAPDSTGNLFDPQPELNAVRGGWRSIPKRIAAAGALAATAATVGAATRRPGAASAWRRRSRSAACRTPRPR